MTLPHFESLQKIWQCHQIYIRIIQNNKKNSLQVSKLDDVSSETNYLLCNNNDFIGKMTVYCCFTPILALEFTICILNSIIK